MIGKRIFWRSHNPLLGSFDNEGTVVAEDGEWLVVRTHRVISKHLSPFVILNRSQVELAQ